MNHAITAQQLNALDIVIEGSNKVTLADLTDSYIRLANDFSVRVKFREIEGDETASGVMYTGSEFIAQQLLKRLDAAGYVVVKKIE